MVLFDGLTGGLCSGKKESDKGGDSRVDTSILSGPSDQKTDAFSSGRRRLNRTRIELLLGRSSTTSGDRRLKCACATHIWGEINDPVRTYSVRGTIGLKEVGELAKSKSMLFTFCWLWVSFVFRSIRDQDPGD